MSEEKKRTIKITITADDKDLKKAEASVDSLKEKIIETGNSGKSLDKVADTLEAVNSEAKKTEKTVDHLEQKIIETGNSGKSLDKVVDKLEAVNSEAKKTEKTVERLEKAMMSKRIDYDSPDFKAKTEAFKKGIISGGGGINSANNPAEEIDALTDSAKGLVAGLNPATIASSLTTAAVTALAAGAILATKTAYDLAESYASYTNTIAKAKESTGLTTETLSALYAEAQRVDMGFEGVTDSLKDLTKTIGDAANGSKDANAKLNRLGIDGKTAAENLDGAFRQALKTIVSLPEGVQRSNAAMDAFGEKGFELIPLINRFNGDIDSLVKSLDDYGVILTDKDIKASKEFDKALKDVQTELRGVGLTIGRELLPVATDLFKSFNGFYKENKNEIKEWATYVSDIFRGVFDGLTKTVNFFKEHWGIISTGGRIILGIATLGTSEITIRAGGNFINDLATNGANLRKNLPPQAETIDKTSPFNNGSYFSGGKNDEKAPSVKEILDAMRAGTMAQESGGRLGVQNKRTNATGLFQVMPENIPNWTQKHLGQRLTIEQFRNSPSAQIAVFNAQMGSYLEDGMNQSKGDWREAVRRAAVRWYGTRANSNDYDQMQRFRADEPSRGEYTASVLRRTEQALKNKSYGQTGDLDKIQDEINKADNAAYAKEGFENRARLIQMTGGMPDAKWLKQYTDHLNKDIPLDRNKLSTADVGKRFEKEVSEISSLVEDVANLPTEFRNSMGDDFVSYLKDSLGTSIKIDEIVSRTEQHYQIIKDLIKDAYANQELTLITLGQQYEVQQKLLGDEKYRQGEKEIAIISEKMSLEREIFDLENQISIQSEGYNDTLKIQAAYLQDILSIRNRELDAVISINRSQLELSQKTVFSQNQANAQILEHLSSVKGVTEIYADARIGIVETFWGSLEEKISKATDKLGLFGNVIKQILMDLVKLATSQIFNQQFGGNGGGQSSGGFNVGNLLGGFLGLGSSSSGNSNRTPSFNPSASNFGENAHGRADVQTITRQAQELLSHERLNSIGGDFGRSSATAGIHETAHAGISTAVSSATGTGGMNWGNLKTSLGSMAPMLGMGLGAGLGGNSLTGQILGSLGGLAGGLAVGVGTGAIGGAGMAGAGLVASLGGAMAATGILAAVAVPLLLGAWLLGRNKQRRADETTRNQAMLDAFSQLDEIKKAIERDKMDGQSGVANANSIRSQYMQQMSQLKDDKTRRIALQDVSRIDSKIDLIKKAADSQDTRRNIDEQWVPVYASGTYMDAGFRQQYGDFKRRNGMLGGSWTGRDYLPSLLADAEMVLNPMQQDRIKNAAGFDVFAGAGIPNYTPKAQNFTPKFADGVNLNYAIPSPSSSANNQNNQPIMISVESIKVDANGIVFEGLKSNTNQKVIFTGQKKIIKNGQN